LEKKKCKSNKLIYLGGRARKVIKVIEPVTIQYTF